MIVPMPVPSVMVRFLESESTTRYVSSGSTDMSTKKLDAPAGTSLEPDTWKSAGALAGRQQLRGAVAVHLASALELGTTDLTFAVWDRRLHAGAVAVGLAVAPAILD